MGSRLHAAIVLAALIWAPAARGQIVTVQPGLNGELELIVIPTRPQLGTQNRRDRVNVMLYHSPFGTRRCDSDDPVAPTGDPKSPEVTPPVEPVADPPRPPFGTQDSIKISEFLRSLGQYAEKQDRPDADWSKVWDKYVKDFRADQPACSPGDKGVGTMLDMLGGQGTTISAPPNSPFKATTPSRPPFGPQSSKPFVDNRDLFGKSLGLWTAENRPPFGTEDIRPDIFRGLPSLRVQ